MHELRQTVLACLLGASWPNTTAKRDATLQVLHGHVRLIVGGAAWDGKTGDYIAIPPQRHALAAVEGSVVMLQMASLPLTRHDFHGEWNYTLQPE